MNQSMIFVDIWIWMKRCVPAVAGIVTRGDFVDVSFQRFADGGADFGQIGRTFVGTLQRHIGKLFLLILFRLKITKKRH